MSCTIVNYVCQNYSISKLYSKQVLTVLSCLVGVDASSVFVVNPIVISVPGRMWQGRLAEQSRY
jgi:hypothetical protein